MLCIVSVDGMEAEGQLLIISAVFNKYLKKKVIVQQSSERVIYCSPRNVMIQSLTLRKLEIQLGGSYCIIFSLSLVSP